MEAVWKISVEDFPAFIVVDDKGNDFFSQFYVQAGSESKTYRFRPGSIRTSTRAWSGSTSSIKITTKTCRRARLPAASG